ncbi:soluble NSF attachment protein [Mortierella sp. GBAus27b]|nr:soluble NSF attachment protein [Mortierella sp. GBAus27b]
MEAAGAYEDAFKAYNMAKQHEPAIRCLENAARLFRSNDRGSSRAAKLYSQLGDLIKAQDGKRAAELYGEAAELYASDGDGRALHSTIRQAEQLCVIHNYERAYTLYVDTIIPQTLSQDILQYTTRDHILNAIIAHLGVTKGDWIVFERDVEHFESMCVDFHTSRARDVLKSLAKAERDHDPEAFRTACQEFNRLSSTGMQDWQVALLLDEKRKLEDSSLL